MQGPEAARAEPSRGRLLFVCGQPRFFSTHRLPLARAARIAGYDVHIAVPRDGLGYAELAREEFPLHPFPLERQGTRPWREAATIVALSRLYGALQPAITHHVGIKLVLYGSVAARARRVPAVVNAVAGLGYVFTRRGRLSGLARFVAKAALRGVLGHPGQRLILQNTTDRDEFVARGIVAASSVVTTVGSGVDLQTFQASRVPDGVPVVMLAARMLWDKGVGEFVEAARTLRARGMDARFVLVGDTDANPTSVSTEQLARWQAEGVIEWWGLRDDMPRVLAEATIVCLPTYREGCPKVLLEAAACARPIVATDVPGCRDVVTDGIEGVLVRPRDAEALATALARLLADPDRCRALGVAGRRRAEREFGIEHVVRITLDTYDALLRGGSAAAR